MCTGCLCTSYCSRKCQEQHWERGHAQRCPVLREGIAKAAAAACGGAGAGKGRGNSKKKSKGGRKK